MRQPPDWLWLKAAGAGLSHKPALAGIAETHGQLAGRFKGSLVLEATASLGHATRAPRNAAPVSSAPSAAAGCLRPPPKPGTGRRSSDNARPVRRVTEDWPRYARRRSSPMLEPRTFVLLASFTVARNGPQGMEIPCAQPVIVL